MSLRSLIVPAGVAAVFAFSVSPASAATQKCQPGSSGGSVPSAVNVYVQQFPTSGSCGKNKGGTISQYVPMTQAATNALRHTSKKNRELLTELARSAAFGAMRPMHLSPAAERSRPPSTLGAAFDLGSGPVMLFAALLAAAVLLAVGGGLRQRRR